MIDLTLPAPDQRRETLIQRMRECLLSYPFTAPGERQLALYKEEHAAAMHHFAAIQALDEHAPGYAANVLRVLLSHANTPTNRQMGAWITRAPAILRSLQQTFAHSAALHEEDWPAAAIALMQFVRRCVSAPHELADACQEWMKLPFAPVFHTGLVSPILHALRSDHFFLVNHTTLRVINYFATSNFSLLLSDYPPTNETARTLMEDVTAALPADVLPGLPATDLFDFFAHWLVSVKKWNLAPPKAWRVAVDIASVDWQHCREDGYIALDLAAPQTETGDRASAARLTRMFTQEIHEGDYLIATFARRVIAGLGRVTGLAYEVADTRLPHRLPVAWWHTAPLTLKRPGWKRPFARLDARTLTAILAQAPPPAEADTAAAPPVTIHETLGEYIPSRPVMTAYTLAACSADTGIALDTLQQWVRSIDRKGQAIIYGPPGTGKTFLAEHLARYLAGSDGYWETVQFHPAYAYEDFMQGIRPQTTTGGALRYILMPGHFLQFCARAQHYSGRSVLIIDEINRANLARVFGELLFLLEYRDRAIALAGGGSLRIPANVRIIGTMNTADRSIALVDYALRRRFAFLQRAPDYTLLRRYHQDTDFPVDALITILERINQEIEDPLYALGTSYFLQPDLAATIADVWVTEIEPYLEEYFFNQPEKVAPWRWEVVRKQLER